ncbi:MAG: efflux RND transporter periplasmic adaptor subunit [Sphingobium sp.]
MLVRKTAKATPLLSLLLLAACQTEQPAETQQPVEVTVLKVAPSPITLSDELPGRVVAFRVAEIRPQVGGVIEKRFFEQGGEVRAGQALFQINPRPFRAEAGIAQATVQHAQATHARAKVQADRLRPLVDADAISRQSYDDAVAARDQAAAELARARATLDRRRLDLDFARVSAPISGRIGQALMTEGALVSPTDATPLAVVQQIDQVYVDIRQPVARMETLRDAVAQGQDAGNIPVEILSATGKAYPSGRLLFSDISVDAGTGDAVVRVVVPNADRRLLPGMFVRARLPRSTRPDALTVPQQSVRRDSSGKAQVAIVDAKGKVAMRDVSVGDVVDGRYVVLKGLRAGETVIVEGHDRVEPGAAVKPKPWSPGPAAAR